MKYFFVVEKDKNSTRHIIVAENEENAKKILSKSKVIEDYMYELSENTFKDEGFLMTQK